MTQDLRVGEVLRTQSGLSTITGVRRKAGDQRVYNFEVEATHAYYVGQTRTLSHNTNCAVTNTDLYGFGNTSGPKGPRAVQDFNLPDEKSMVRPVEPPAGASTFDDWTTAPVKGRVWKLPKGTELPEGLGVRPDGLNFGGLQPPGHHTIHPTQEMPFDQFSDKCKALPWQDTGQTKK